MGRVTAGVGPVISPKPYATVKVAVSSNDPSQKARMVARSNLFVLSGTASNNGIAASVLTLTLDGQKVSVPLSRGYTPATTFGAIERALPPGYTAQMLTQKRTGKVDTVTVRITKNLSPPSTRLEVTLANDPAQRVSFTGGNKLTITGTATSSGIIPSFVNLMVDGQRVVVRVKRGDGAQTTAENISAALPKSHRAQVENTEAGVVITIVRA
ncbi:MAG: hypothetical protein ACOZIN_07105 [Myxococcota bacterium]